MGQEILMLVGQARLEPSSSLADTAAVVQGCSEEFHWRFVTYTYSRTQALSLRNILSTTWMPTLPNLGATVFPSLACWRRYVIAVTVSPGAALAMTFLSRYFHEWLSPKNPNQMLILEYRVLQTFFLLGLQVVNLNATAFLSYTKADNLVYSTLEVGRFRLQKNRNSGSLANFSTISSNRLLFIK